MDVSWVAFRVLKHLGVAMLAGGLVGAYLPELLRDRQRAVYWLATPGLIVAWAAGYGLAKQVGHSLGAPWISASMLLSLLMFQVLIFSVEREGRRQAGYAALSALLMASVVVLMVWRPGV